MSSKSRIITIYRRELKERNLKLSFNNNVFDIYPNKTLHHEICPGIFVSCYFLFDNIIKRIEIEILNKRDSIIIFLEDEIVKNPIKTVIYEFVPSFYNVQPIIDLSLTIPIDCIRYPTNEIGGNGDRCIIKEMMKDLDIYPKPLQCEKRKYNLFSYEDIFALPDSIPGLKQMCCNFCFQRNKENVELKQTLNIVDSSDKVESSYRLINKTSDEVTLSILKDNTLITTNGNHRLCFLKRFKKDFGLNSLNFEKDWQISQGGKESILNDIAKKKYTEYYYKEMENKGISKEEALKVLSDGLSPSDLFKLILEKKDNKEKSK